MLEINQIYNIDCLEGLKQLDDNSIDSIVTDPPYELGFMNRPWDQTGIAFNVDLWRECLRVLKPGGHILVAGIGRTHHRTMCAIEEAGFEIRDCIYHIFGSGFPKSLDISKAIDKELGAERKVVGISDKQPAGYIRHGRTDQEVFLGTDTNRTPAYITAPATPEAERWKGWGTGLKPAAEIWVLARKPLSEKNVALNMLKWGTGGINIDGCRIGIEQIKTHGIRNGTGNSLEWSKYVSPEGFEGNVHTGRFPANVILDEEAAKLLDEQSGILKSGGGKKGNIKDGIGIFGNGKAFETKEFKPDSGGASRFFKIIDYDDEDFVNFFYCAKASKKEKGEFNNHPTVKPLKLIEYLIKLITPPGGVCLDPFEGSGTHALACLKLGVNYIGFEIDSNYYQIIQKRIAKYSVNPARRNTVII